MLTKFVFSDSSELVHIDVKDKKYYIHSREDAERMVAVILNHYQSGWPIKITEIRHYDDKGDIVESFEV